MSLSFEISGAQIDGAREYQEDAYLITKLPDSNSNGAPGALVIVTDGMGGHAAGNVASNMVVQAFNKYITANYPADFPSEVLNEAVLKANHSIAETVRETPALEGMGCTLVAAILEGNEIYWASVGDSHLYLLRDRKLTKINTDHSYGGFLDAMEAAGTPIEAESGLSRNMLMSAITGSDISDIDCPEQPLQLKAGDKILICSDGMNTLSEGKIIQYIDWSDTPKEAIDSLLNAIEDANAAKQDNATAVVIHIVDNAVQSAITEEDDEDDGEITDVEYKASTTIPMSVESQKNLGLESTKEEAPPKEPVVKTPLKQPEPPAAPPVEDSRSGNKTLIAGIAIAGIVIIAIAAYFLMPGDSTAEQTELPPAAEQTIDDTIAPSAETALPPDVPTPTETLDNISGKKQEPVEEVDTVPPATAEKVLADDNPTTPNIIETFQDTLKIGGTAPTMVWIPAGSFEMGSPRSSRFSEERPRHTVTLEKFAISQYEITFSEYGKFARATGRRIPNNQKMDRDTHPVVFVSKDDAANYARWLSKQTGETYRLPTEAEWEYAASGGAKSPFWWGFDEKQGMAHCFGCGSKFPSRKPAKVGSFQANAYGVYDTAGNVAEWVQDCWHDNYENAPTDGSIWEGGDCEQHIARGGSYISPMQSASRSKRDKYRPGNNYDHIGIRLVREAN